jgi:hypothetical protein
MDKYTGDALRWRIYESGDRIGEKTPWLRDYATANT